MTRLNQIVEEVEIFQHAEEVVREAEEIEIIQTLINQIRLTENKTLAIKVLIHSRIRVTAETPTQIQRSSQLRTFLQIPRIPGNSLRIESN